MDLSRNQLEQIAIFQVIVDSDPAVYALCSARAPQLIECQFLKTDSPRCSFDELNRQHNRTLHTKDQAVRC